MVPGGQGGGHKMENYFTFVYWKESFKMKHLANFKLYRYILHDGNSSLFKEGSSKSSSKRG
jgi:hypothetical protein